MLEIASEYATIIGLPVALLTIFVSIWLAGEPRRTERKLSRAFGADSFDEQQILRALKGYVEPDCSQLDPSGEDDSRRQFSVRSPLIPEMDKLLSERHEGKHVLLLADSGMGKTSFLLHYYARNRSRRVKERERIAVVPLGRPGVEAKIAEIQSKRETIIFLDALDEDTGAIRDHRARLEQLMRYCADFRRVVVSCRTQFFPNDEEIPRETGIAQVGPRKAGEGRILRFYKLYLAPFSDEQVRSYIRARFPIWKWAKRKLAYAVVMSIPELSVRPMLLALVPDLVSQRRAVKALYDLYEFMVDSWLEREQDWIDKDELRRFSEILAVDLYLHRQDRGMERISRVDLAALINLNTTELESWKLTSRSLLNRDGDGNFKFSHRSIMEYLLVSAFIKGNSGALNVEWTDLMRQLFVSWGSVAVASRELATLTRISNSDFRITHLFPIFRQPRAPERLTKGRMIKPVRDSELLSLYSSLRNVPRGLYATATAVGDATVICDFSTDSVYWLPLDVVRLVGGSDFLEIREMFLLTRASVQNQINAINSEQRWGRSDWRAPTLEEFDALFLLSERIPMLDSKACRRRT